MIVYFDTSAFVKLFVDEPGSDEVTRLRIGANQPVCVEVGYVEARAGLAGCAAVVASRTRNWRRLAECSSASGSW